MGLESKESDPRLSLLTALHTLAGENLPVCVFEDQTHKGFTRSYLLEWEHVFKGDILIRELFCHYDIPKSSG